LIDWFDLSRWGNGEINAAKPKARKGQASGHERVHPVGIWRTKVSGSPWCGLLCRNL